MAYVAGELTVGLYAEMVQFQRDMQAASMSLGRLAQEAKAAQSEVSVLDKSLKTAAVAAGAMIASTAVLAKRSFMAAASVAEMDTAMGAIEKSSGLAEGSLRDAADAIRAKGIEMRSAQEIAVLFAKAEIDLADATKVARAAQDLAVISQSNSTATAMRLTYAIQTGNSQLLRSVGIQKYASEAYEGYAQSIGKATTSLTQQERQQAITNMVLEEAAKVAGAYEAAMLEPGKVLRSFPRLLNDMQIAFGDVLLEGFGPVIKASYDFTKQVSLAVREGGYFAPLLNEMQEAVTALLAPLSQFIYGLADSLKTLNESQIAVGGLSESLQKFAPIIMGAATALSAFAGGSLIGLIPGLGKISALIGLRSPIVLGFIALTAMSDELRDTLGKLVEAVLPLATAFAEVGEVMASQLIMTAEAFIPLLVGMVQAITPVIAAFAQFVELVTSSEAWAKLLGVALLALIVNFKVLKTQAVASLIASMAGLGKAVGNLIVYMRVLALEARSSGATLKAFGAMASAGFTQAAVAAKAFIASLLPLAAITAAVWALTAAFSAFSNRNKDAKERMEELTPRVEELVDELARGEAAAKGFGDAMAKLGEILLDDATDGGKKTADALRVFGVEGDKAVDTALRLHTEFDQVALELLATKGVTGEAADEILRLVNTVDKGDDPLWRLSGRTKYLAEQLEELQDQVENSGEVFKLLASEMLAEAEAQGALTDALYDEIQALIDAGDHSGAYELALAAVNAQLLEQERLLRYKIEAQTMDEAQLERLIFLNQTYAERLGHVADETTLITSLSYEQARATRNTVRQMNKLTDELADSDKEFSSLLKAGDSFVELLVDTEAEMKEMDRSTEQINSMIAVLSTRFAEAAGEAGYTQDQLNLLAQDILALSGMSVDLPIGITLTGDVSEQIKAIRGQLRAIEQRVMIEPHLASQIKPLKDMLNFLEPLESAFSMIDDSGGAFENSAGGMNDAARSAGRLANELDDVADAYREIVQELLSVDFALTNSEVLLEELRDRALEVAKAFDQMSDAKRLQEFHGQVQQVLSMMRDLAASGASMGEIDNFVEQLIGPNGALAVFAKSAGISTEDFAKAVAAIEGFQFQIGQEQQFAAATAGMTPEEVEQFSKYLLGLEASGAIPSQDFSSATVSAGSTTINVNLPPGVSGVDVVNALQDYAQTSGASIQAPFEFVNLG